MTLLLDTNALIWWLNNKLSQSIRGTIERENEVYVSAASAWEIATKVRKRKLVFPASFLEDFDRSLRLESFEPLVITSKHALTGANFPGEHKDPFDRIIAGQAKCEGLTVVTSDKAFKTFGIDVLW